MYVTNRVSRIRKLSKPNQWSYIPTELNPADAATRSVPPDKLQDSMWLNGPPTLNETSKDLVDTDFPLLNTEQDKEIRPNVQVMKTGLQESTLALTHRIERFSVWKILVNTFRRLKIFAKTFQKDKTDDLSTSYNATENFVISNIQSEVFSIEINCIRNKLPLPKTSRIRNLNPFIDDIGMLRLGGRISKADIDFKLKHPLIIPGNNCYISASQSPPFSSVGIDTFGPWSIVTRKTRGGQANSKRWALLFTCLSTRAIHIEVIEELSLSSFINALRRFIALRGSIKEIRSDRGANFVEVCAIVNGRPIVSVSSDPESPLILSPAMLLTQKAGCYPAPIGTFDTKDLYKAQWKRVQHLADIFWQRWNKKYLQTLQTRRKWTDSSPNVKQGDIVLIKDKNVSRNAWTTCIIVNPLPGHDGRVRKAEVRVARNGSTYTRPISEMVLLLRV
ncbi:Hypothetical predicted protein [Mytilus galloprovincialis]|uniref:DUF5641 domain-containing protein n=1 Tax=Mytilus galloprovincialis TaxID=29158 RepID=A0A8B6HFI3_MYTGA|nr:Hypothetical predicted protein [Mytilus galloprovincialis]